LIKQVDKKMIKQFLRTIRKASLPGGHKKSSPDKSDELYKEIADIFLKL